MKGFIVSDYADKFDEGLKQLAEWVNAGRLKYKENIVEGLKTPSMPFWGCFTERTWENRLSKLKTGLLIR